MSDLRDYRVAVTETVEHACEVAVDREDVLAWLQESCSEHQHVLDDVTPEVVKEWLESERDFDPGAFVSEHAYGGTNREDYSIESVEVIG